MQDWKVVVTVREHAFKEACERLQVLGAVATTDHDAARQRYAFLISIDGRIAAMTLAVRVECYAGYRGEEAPQRFYIGDRMLEIGEVLDRWLAPEHRYFKVKVVSGDIYILRHDVGKDSWELTLYDSGRVESTRLSST